MEQHVVSEQDSQLYDKFVKGVQSLHADMLKEATGDQKMMGLYIAAVNMIGNIYQSHSAKDKRIMLRGFISDVRMNFKGKKVLE
jgi:hypothetical protein